MKEGRGGFGSDSGKEGEPGNANLVVWDDERILLNKIGIRKKIRA